MEIVFWIIAAVTLGAALLMVASKNIFHSSLFMVVTFLGVAAVFVSLYADFLAAVQVLVYAGAITIFMVFGIMLTVRGSMKQTNLFSKNVLAGGFVAIALVALNTVMVLKTKWPVSNAGPPENTISHIADLLLNKYVVPFEVTAILLLIALLGAIIIAKEVSKQS